MMNNSSDDKQQSESQSSANVSPCLWAGRNPEFGREGDDTGSEEKGRDGDTNRSSLENVIAVETAGCSRQATELHGYYCNQRQYQLTFLPAEDYQSLTEL